MFFNIDAIDDSINPIEMHSVKFHWCNSDFDVVTMDRKVIAYLSVIVSILLTIYTSYASSFFALFCIVRSYIYTTLFCLLFRIKTSSSSKSLGIKVNVPPVRTLFSYICIQTVFKYAPI